MQLNPGVVILLGGMILLGGCVGLTGEKPENQNSTTATTPALNAQATSTSSASLKNPWQDQNISITVSGVPHESSDYYEEKLRKGIGYWSDRRISKYTNYQLSFEFHPSSSPDGSDIHIRLVDEIDQCGLEVSLTSHLGCADYLSADDRVDTASVRIVKDQIAIEFRNTVSHELGHVLGLGHEDRPYWLMSTKNRTKPETNAIDRENPWNHSRNIRISVKDTVQNASEIRNRIQAAADFYNRNSDRYLPEDMRITVVKDWRNSDIVFQDEAPGIRATVDLRPTSRPYVSGLDYDRDDEYEKYTGVRVQLSYIETMDLEYHTGHWIGYFSGVSKTDLPGRYRSE